jgi:hypothetical protein
MRGVSRHNANLIDIGIPPPSYVDGEVALKRSFFMGYALGRTSGNGLWFSSKGIEALRKVRVIEE